MPRRLSPTHTNNATSSHSNFHPTLTAFHDYILAADITTHPALELKELPGRGIGVVAAAPIAPGTELMWVPTSALLQPACVPESFIPSSIRSLYGGEGEGPRMRTHALLAAWIAFGECGEHEAWMATWPSLEDMQVGMPICWPEAAKGVRTRAVGGKEQDQEFAVLPWDISGKFATVPFLPIVNALSTNGKKRRSKREDTHPPPVGLLPKQQAKFDLDIRSIQDALPHVSDALKDPSSQQHSLFLHAWLIVNSRCFYYVPPGCLVPEDSDEAMTLCPAVDIFNHNDGDGCEVSHDEDGFTVRVNGERTLGYGQGEEFFVSYGSHANDLLWVEYGFLLEQNKWDSITIPDQVVLSGLSPAERGMLEEKEYMGGYSINQDGVCWRTEVVSWLGVTTQNQWEELVSGLWYPGSEETERPTKPSNGGDEMICEDIAKRRASKKIASWLLQIREEVGNSLAGLLTMNEEEVMEVFGDGKEIARHRLEMTTKRWKQIWSVCNNAMNCIELDCPGSFLAATQLGKKFADLNLDVQHFIDMLRVDANEKHLPR